MTDLDRPLYDVDPEWSPERKEAFGLYRDMGPERNLRGVAQVLHKSLTLLGRWSTEDGWVRRVAAWDVYQDKMRQKEAAAARLEVSRRHAESLDTTLKVITQPALELARRLDAGELNLSDMTNAQLLEASTIIGRVMPRIVVASRLVHGMSTEQIDDKTDQQKMIENATPEELDEFLAPVDTGDAGIVERTQLQLPAPSE